MDKNEETIVYEQLRSFDVDQLLHLVRLLNLDKADIDNITTVAIGIISDQIIQVTRGKYGEHWKSAIDKAINEVQIGTAKDYWARKLEHLKGYLVDPSEPKHDKSRELLGVSELLKRLEEFDQGGDDQKGDDFKDPQLIRVTGTLFPAALLSAGWWEGVRKNKKIYWRDSINGGNSLQQWLFEGFDEWAPSWDISWDFEGREQNTKPYYIAQLADGDEANSLPVIIPQKLAEVWRDKFKKSWGGLQVEITGTLGYRKQAREKVPEAKEDIKGPEKNYCIWLKDNDERYEIKKHDETELYSGYLWQCWIPRSWMEAKDENDVSIELKDVYIVWEHTNFAAPNARNYNLSSLKDKVSYIEKLYPEYGGLILLQKSHNEVLVPGHPLWPVEDFYKLLGGDAVEKKPTNP